MEDIKNVQNIQNIKIFAPPADEGKNIAEKALKKYYEAREALSRTSEEIMDKHHQTVAKSMELQKEHMKKKLREQRAKESKANADILHEEAVLKSINHRNMLQKMRDER